MEKSQSKKNFYLKYISNKMFALSFCKNTLKYKFKANGKVLKKENFL
jgi:hypothetical protein